MRTKSPQAAPSPSTQRRTRDACSCSSVRGVGGNRRSWTRDATTDDATRIGAGQANPQLDTRFGRVKFPLLQHALLGDGNVVAGGVLDRVHHLVGLADDLVSALGVFGVSSEAHGAADVQLQPFG